MNTFYNTELRIRAYVLVRFFSDGFLYYWSQTTMTQTIHFQLELCINVSLTFISVRDIETKFEGTGFERMVQFS